MYKIIHYQIANYVIESAFVKISLPSTVTICYVCFGSLVFLTICYLSDKSAIVQTDANLFRQGHHPNCQATGSLVSGFALDDISISVHRMKS